MKLLQEIKIPHESVNDEYVTVVTLFFKNNDFVAKGDILIELETSKTIFSIESEFAGYIKYYCKEEQDVLVNTTIIKIFDKINTNNETKKIDNNYAELGKIDTVFSKKALRYIQDKNINISFFNNHDFVNIEDIHNLLNIKQDIKENIEEKLTTNNLILDNSKVKLRKITKNKKKEIEYLKAIQQENLNSTVSININTRTLFNSINPSLKFFKNSLLPVIIYETARLLQKYPEFNAFFVDNQLAIYNDINIGFAIDIDNGLKTVKIKDTHQKTLKEIEQHIFDLSNNYIDNKLEVSDLTDITFTITDLSSEGVDFFIPLINKNNSAILGICTNDNKLNRSKLSLTFDHRVTEGKKATIFLRELKERIESFKQERGNIIDHNIRCHKCLKNLKDDFNEVGFIKVITKNNEEKYICQTCLAGF